MVKVWILREESITDSSGKVRIRRVFLCECGVFRVEKGMREHLREQHRLNEEEITRTLELAEPKTF